jgi:RNA polymerase primary sigma factor
LAPGRLVVAVARRYGGRGVALEDLVAEGNLGLIRAVEAFDPSLGTRFSTYATHWIRQAVRRVLTNTSRAIRLPAYVEGLLGKWRRAAAALAGELGRPPADAEVALRLGLPAKKLKVVRQALSLRAALGAAGGAEGPPRPDGGARAPDRTGCPRGARGHAVGRLRAAPRAVRLSGGWRSPRR